MNTLKRSQKIPLSLEETWKFFSSPENLKIITPEYLGFEILNDLGSKRMYAGQIIAYKMRPIFNFPMTWVTEITHVDKPNYFVDEQRLGPYIFWHHEHRFYPIVGGTEISDTVYYKLPFGIFGTILHVLKVRKDIEEIFSYRKAMLEKMFGPY